MNFSVKIIANSILRAWNSEPVRKTRERPIHEYANVTRGFIGAYFQALSNSEIGIRARRAAIGKEKLRRPGLLEPTEKLVSRDLTDPIAASSLEDGEIESGVNEANQENA